MLTNEKGDPIGINSYDPANDIKFLETELNQWFFNVISKHWQNVEKKVRMQDQKIEEALGSVVSGLNIKEHQILTALRELEITKANMSDNLFELSKKLREITKPIMIAANKCDVLIENDLWKIKLEKLQKEFPNYKIIPIAAEYEYNLRKAAESKILFYISGEDNFQILNENSLTENQKAGLSLIEKNLKKLGGTGVQDALNYAVFDLLKMKPIYPGSEKSIMGKTQFVIPDCFLMEENATALDFAYRLHTDFGKNFIKAIDVKRKLMVGKDHVLKFGDVIEIISGK